MYVRFVSHYQDKVVRAKGCINSVRDSCTFPDYRSDGQCEVQVDAFLQLYCANETTISTGTTAPTVTVTQVGQITTTTTVYSTTSHQYLLPPIMYLQCIPSPSFPIIRTKL